MIRKVFFRLDLFILPVKYKELQPGSIRPLLLFTALFNIPALPKQHKQLLACASGVGSKKKAPAVRQGPDGYFVLSG
jgi:hypothetical protein